MKDVEKIKKIFKENNGVLCTAQLEQLGIYYRKRQALLEKGIIQQVRRGYYQYVDEKVISELPVITKLFPDGILFMESALEQHGYLEKKPSEWHIAVDYKSARKRFEIDAPKVKPHFIRTENLQVGIDTMKIDGIKVQVYDKEKTICDCLKHRNKMDAEVFQYAIQCYAKDEKKNLKRLSQYAKKIHVEKKIKDVLEVMIMSEKDKDLKYEQQDENMIRETTVPYGKKQGSYTLEDYYALPDDIRVELIDGVIYDMSAPTLAHQFVGGEIFFKIKQYINGKQGNCIPFAAPVDVQLDCDDKTMVQPDVIIVCDKDKRINRCVYGAPDFVAEVLSPSTRKKDSMIKLRKYQEAGVREYWMIDLKNEKVITYFFEEDVIPVIYGAEDEVPVRIYGDDLKISMKEIFERIKDI